MIDQDYVCAVNHSKNLIRDVWPNGTKQDLIEQLSEDFSEEEIGQWVIEEWRGKYQITYIPVKISYKNIVWKKVVR